MATIEKDRPTPGEKSAGDSGEVGNGKPPIEKRSPPWQPENPDGKDRTKPVAKESARTTGDVGSGKAPIEKRIPPGRPGNQKGKHRPKPLAKKSASATGEVGYGKPPVSKRFLPGQSANPLGRPRGAKNKLPAFGLEKWKSSFLAELRTVVTFGEGKTAVKLSAMNAIIRKTIQKAIAGDLRAAQIMITMGQAVDAAEKEFYEQFSLRAMIFLKVWEEACEDAKTQGRILIPPFPFHHLSVNRANGRVEIHGPISFDGLTNLDVNTGRVFYDAKGWGLAEVEDPIAIARWFMTVMRPPEGEHFEDYLP